MRLRPPKKPAYEVHGLILGDQLASLIHSQLAPYEGQAMMGQVALTALKTCASVILTWISQELPPDQREAFLDDFCAQVCAATHILIDACDQAHEEG